jgi:hypothetical protein
MFLVDFSTSASCDHNPVTTRLTPKALMEISFRDSCCDCSHLLAFQYAETRKGLNDSLAPPLSFDHLTLSYDLGPVLQVLRLSQFRKSRCSALPFTFKFPKPRDSISLGSTVQIFYSINDQDLNSTIYLRGFGEVFTFISSVSKSPMYMVLCHTSSDMDDPH